MEAENTGLSGAEEDSLAAGRTLGRLSRTEAEREAARRRRRREGGGEGGAVDEEAVGVSASGALGKALRASMKRSGEGSEGSMGSKGGGDGRRSSSFMASGREVKESYDLRARNGSIEIAVYSINMIFIYKTINMIFIYKIGFIFFYYFYF